MRSLLLHPHSRRRRRALRRVLLAAGLLFAASPAGANPNGGIVRGGSATISGQGTAQVDVVQHSQGAVLSWEHFNIAPGEVTNFHQPNASATAINRILQQNPSQILGSLNANGNVYLINPNGFLFGATAKINTHSFAAMTGIDAEGLKKLTGGYDASAQSAPGAKIENHGAIQSGDGGFVYLIAPRVENGKDAVITTPEGEVLLAAGATVTLTDDPSGVGLGIRYTAPGKAGGEAVNLGKIVANGGFARMRADVVRQGGLVQANAVRERAGKIELYASNSLTLAPESVTEAAGGAGKGPGGVVSAKSEGDAQMDPGALLDVSGGAAGGDGGAAELSAKGNLSLSGTLRAGAKAGSKRGSISIDPTILTVPPSDVNLQGAGAIVVEASQRIEVSTGAKINLADNTQAGDDSADRQSLTLRSGGDISFGRDSSIVDDGTGAGGQKIWDVNLVAGADLASPNLLAVAGSKGSIYLSGATFDGTGAVTSLGSNNGEVALTRGNLTVRAAGDLVIGNGGGLKDETGQIDIAIGGDLSFRARRDVDSTGQPIEGVIENGSGDISIVAAGSIHLAESPNTSGNAAIRTRGVAGTDALGQTTISDGGSIFIQVGGDVDAGVGNRWLEPGPPFTAADYADLVSQLPPDAGPPPGYAPPNFDPMPVVRQGILGIGTEAGGDVTIVAGGSVRTGASSVTRSGATAAGLGTQYNGSHIGVFGVPVVQAIDYLTGVVRNAVLPGAPQSHLTVVAGDAIEGDFAMRNGEAEMRAGYALASRVSARTLDPAHLDASLVESGAAQANATHGWFGTLARPVTVDLIDASVEGVGRNGVAIRAIENPSLVYPPARLGTSAIPTYQETDSATLRSPEGDVFLVGNEISMPSASLNGQIAPNPLVRVLPPNVSIQTDRGDLVMVNDFLLYPSERGGLDLQIAGQVRTAGLSASTNAQLALTLLTAGATGDRAFTIPAGTKLRDPATGNTYTVSNALTVASRTPPTPAQGSVVFHLSPEAASGTFTIPTGTIVSASDGRLYRVVSDAILLPPAQRLSQGQVTFYASGGGASKSILIDRGTQLIGPNGSRFLVTAPGTLQPGQLSITLNVVAAPESPGIDAPAYALSLASPIAGIDRAGNLSPTVRPTDLTATVMALDVGSATNAFPHLVSALVSPIPGVESVDNPKQLQGGADLAPFGIGQSVTSSITTGKEPLVTADVLGPAGELVPGTRLVIEDPSVLPAGVNASEILFAVDQIAVGAAVSPTLFRKPTLGNDGTLRPDPAPGTVASVSPAETWIRDGAGVSARIGQSDAAPGIDGRSLNGSFDYFGYLSSCRSGVACAQGLFGSGPTHADDRNRDSLRVLGGFDRVQIQLAKAVFVLTGDPGPDGLFGTPDDGADGSLADFALIAQNNRATDETVVWAPIGSASLGADPPAPGVAPDAFSGMQVAGPGTAKFLIGVLPNKPQLDLNGNGKIDPEENTGDRNGDGHVDASEWQGAPEVFAHLDASQRTINLDGPGPFFTPRTIFAGDGSLTPDEAPYVSTRPSGGTIHLAGAFSSGIGVPLQGSLGLQTIGNVEDTALPVGSAKLDIVANDQIDLNARGSIETYQGGALFVESVGGGVSAASPPPGFTGRRGIVTLFRAPAFGDFPADPSGGGEIGVDVDRDFNVGGLALAALSGSNVTIYSRQGSIDAGVSTPFTKPSVFVGADGTVNVSYQGGGIAAPGGNVGLFAKQDIRIGAGITGAGITISATNVTGTGTGSLNASGSLNISASGSITGNISAGGSINVSGGANVQGASLSAGGIVAGAGAGVGSNAGAGKASAELNQLGSKAEASGFAGLQNAAAGAAASHGVVIQVSSRVIDSDSGDDDSKKRR